MLAFLLELNEEINPKLRERGLRMISVNFFLIEVPISSFFSKIFCTHDSLASQGEVCEAQKK